MWALCDADGGVVCPAKVHATAGRTAGKRWVDVELSDEGLRGLGQNLRRETGQHANRGLAAYILV